MEVRANRNEPLRSRNVIQSFEPSKHAYPSERRRPIILTVEYGEAGYAGGIDAGGIDQGDAYQASPRLMAGAADQHKPTAKRRRKDDSQQSEAASGSASKKSEANSGSASQKSEGASGSGSRKSEGASGSGSRKSEGATGSGSQRSGAGSGSASQKSEDSSSSTPRIKESPDPRMSRSFEYSVAVLESFSRERRPLGISELANIMGLSRPTTHRYAVTLVALGYLEQDGKRRYRLSTRASGPGRSAIGAVRRQVSAGVALEELRDEVGHTVSMGVLDRDRVVYVHRLFGHRRGQYAIDLELGVGASVPVYCTALGKVLLASVSDAERSELIERLQLVPHGPNSIVAKSELSEELARMNPREPTLSDEELTAGSRSVAVLLPRPSGEYPLAIEVTVPSSAYTAKQLLEQVGPMVKRTAELICEP